MIAFTTIDQVLQRQGEIISELEKLTIRGEAIQYEKINNKSDFSRCWIDLRRAIDQDDAKKINDTMKAMAELIEKRL